MELNIKSNFGGGKKLTMLASIICLSVLGTACKDEQIVENEAKNAPVEVVQSTEKTVEKVAAKIEKNSDVVVSEIAQKVEKAKEDLKSFDTDIVPNKTSEKNDDGTMEIIITDIYVVDGDTIHGVDQDGKKIKVRMTGIDAPESKQVMGEESAEALRQCVGFNENALLTVQTNNATDKYGRTLARVESAGINCNQQQIEKGMAWFYEDFGDKLSYEDHKLYNTANDYAQDNSIGIWSMDLQKPWDYRKENK
jgi:endonuclease YncB( thermonuclease family)